MSYYTDFFLNDVKTPSTVPGMPGMPGMKKLLNKYEQFFLVFHIYL